MVSEKFRGTIGNRERPFGFAQGKLSTHRLRSAKCRFPSASLRAGFRLTTPKLCPNEQRPLVEDPGTAFGAPFAQNDRSAYSGVIWMVAERAWAPIMGLR